MLNKVDNILSKIDQDISSSIFVFRPKHLIKSANFFLQNFKAKSLYAVKTNPDLEIIKILNQNGINAFDVASLNEIELIKNNFPKAELFFMHPVKSREAIKKAYFDHNIRHFSLDSEAELEKIKEETKFAEDLTLHIRLAIPNNFAELSLDKKFGVNLQDAVDLIKKTAKYAAKIGVCFHVGSQCMHPDAYKIAIRMATDIIKQSKVKSSYFNVGGGFPSIYPGMIPPDLEEYFKVIHDEFDKIENSDQMTLLAEPGRAIVAESMSLIVRVELRKGDCLYINDGTYGNLFDAGTPNFIFPTKLLHNEKITASDLQPFSFYGPTCDSLDYMAGPFYLPSNIEEGDYIEIGQMGAYAKTMATNFNGFIAHNEVIIIEDEPLMTMYEKNNHSKNEKIEIIAA